MAVIDDAQLSDGALRAYAIMLAVRDDDRCSIGERTLAKRLHRSPRTAHSYIHELVDRGHVQVMNAEYGRRSTYRLTALTAANGFSSPHDPKVGPQQNLATTAANGFSATAESGFSYPRVDILPRGDIEKENDDAELRERARLRLMELFGRTNGTEKECEREAESLLRWWRSKRERLLEHVADAIADPSFGGKLAPIVACVRWKMLNDKSTRSRAAATGQEAL